MGAIGAMVAANVSYWTREPNKNLEVGVVSVNGREFAATGYSRRENRLSAYLGKNGVLTTWAGKPIGKYKIVRTWRVPNGWLSGQMHQVYAVLEDGTTWTGRISGIGMLLRARQTMQKVEVS